MCEYLLMLPLLIILEFTIFGNQPAYLLNFETAKVFVLLVKEEWAAFVLLWIFSILISIRPLIRYFSIKNLSCNTLAVSLP